MKAFVLSALFFIGACSKSSTQPDPLQAPVDTLFVKGADVGWITEMESAGKKFFATSGVEKDGLAILKDLGVNTARLRVWVNPAGGWNGRNDLLVKAARVKAQGMRLMIDFHYSDSWADPGKQFKPAAWNSLTFSVLKDSVAKHTKETLQALQSIGVKPEWVQVGNETNDGMLWPDGKASTNMANFAALINAGYDAVKAVLPSCKVILHLSNGYDNGLYRWMLDGLQANGGKYDVIGLSLYPDASNWLLRNQQCAANMNDLVTRYGKEVMVVEIGMSWNNPDAKSFIANLVAKVKAIPSGKGLGVLYWEPLAYNNWQGYTLGAFDNSGKPTQALTAFQ